MNSFIVSVSGTKEQARAQVEDQIKDDAAFLWVEQLIDQAPGTHVSLSGSLNVAEDGSHGSISLSGSFWSA